MAALALFNLPSSARADIDPLSGVDFVTITHASLVESHPHDVTITKDAPNYSVSQKG